MCKTVRHKGGHVLRGKKAGSGVKSEKFLESFDVFRHSSDLRGHI